MNVSEIKSIESEAGIIATILLHPDFTFYSEYLKPNHFSDEQNAYLYWAISELAKKNVEKIDAYNITNILNSKESTKKWTDILTIPAITELIDLSKEIARGSPDEYKILVDSVMNKALRRETYKSLVECEKLCFSLDETDIDQKISTKLDNVMMEFSTAKELPQYKNVIDDVWADIEADQSGKASLIPFKFKELNKYASIQPGELFLFAAYAKQGKSMILMNCLTDLLRQGKSVLYIDSELSTKAFTKRLMAHLSKIEFARVSSGKYSEEEKERIYTCIEWMKSKNFTHIYLPMFDAKTIFSTVKKVYHTQGIDVLIIDYFKSKRDGDAFTTYQEMGKLADMVKNQICGDMNIAGIGAVQATSTGKIADSSNIGRSASTVALIQEKTPEEIEADGSCCGNKKLRVVLNRNGMQMTPDEYIDLNFNGNLISYEEAKQHVERVPY